MGKRLPSCGNRRVVVEPPGIFLRSVSPQFFVYTFGTLIMSQGFCTPRTPTPAKLSELRAKTDRQLRSLVDSKLDVGLSFAALAEVEESAGDRAYAERSFEQADQALAEVQRLLPALREEHGRGLHHKLTGLREALARLGRSRKRPRSNAASMS